MKTILGEVMREFSALLDARRETGIDDCTIVTWDEEHEEGGVRADEEKKG